VLTISLHQDGCFPPGYGGEDDRGSGTGEGYNINVPLLPGSGHDAYLYAMEQIVVPAAERYKPELIVVSSGLDANGVDPLARMLAHSGTFRELTLRTMALADRFCDGRLAIVHEGGYAEAVVPFCGAAIMEALSGESSDIEDPTEEFISTQQPKAEFAAFQRGLLDRLAQSVLATGS
jgi:acetoin utilization deacetylase AcuC-like enzyme